MLRPQAGPHTLKGRRWGGERLARLRGAAGHDAAPDADPIGESWEFSTLPGSESRADDRPLSEVLGHSLPFLAKLIDTRSALSIQVHPDDDPAAGTPGKEEAWIILDADEGAHVLAGTREGIDHATLEARTRAAVADPDRGPELIDSLDKIDLHRGTIVLVPARTVHAIGGGVLLAEIQQPSDCTYRLFDYGSGRDIHPDQALAAASVEARPVVWRDGEAPATLAGKHLDLRPCPAGTHEFDATADEHLVVVVHGTATVGEETLAPGDLCLCADGPFTLQVDRGLAVVGSLPRP